MYEWLFHNSCSMAESFQEKLKKVCEVHANKVTELVINLTSFTSPLQAPWSTRLQCSFSSMFCLGPLVSLQSMFSTLDLIFLFLRFSARLFLDDPLFVSLLVSTSKPPGSGCLLSEYMPFHILIFTSNS